MSVEERITQARDWVSNFASHPHPELGRDGVVCPYMVKALRRKYITLREFDASAGNDAALGAAARQLRGTMVEHAAAVGPDHIYLVYLIVPYGRPEADLKAMVARVHRWLKPEFVERGLMLGDFWPQHETPGLHSQTFRPFASPLPMLGMRHIVPADLVFFITPDLAPEEQLSYLGHFHRAFEGRLNEYWQGRLDESEAAARRALPLDALTGRANSAPE